MNYDDIIMLKKLSESISIFLKNLYFLVFFKKLFGHGVKIVRNAPLLHRHCIVSADNILIMCPKSHHLRCGVKTVENLARFTPSFSHRPKVEIQQIEKLKSRFSRMK